MAYTKILSITTENHVTRAVKYAMNDNKTSINEHMENAVAYIENENKTVLEGEQYVTGINCYPTSAADKMLATKKTYNKTGRRLGYQIIQSFAPGEVSPAIAHDIGVKFAEEFLSDFEVVVGTHLDRNHFHNHIIFNSVSCIDGHKFHLSKSEFYDKLRGISDRLCREHGLSVIQYVDGRKITYDEWAKRYSGTQRSMKQIIQGDVEDCVKQADSVGEFYVMMENKGYEVNTNGKYAKVKPIEAAKFFRLSTLGYPDEVIRQKIVDNDYTQSQQKRRRYYYSCGTRLIPRTKKLTQYQAMYIRWLFVLGVIKKNPSRSGNIPIAEYRKFDMYKKQYQFVSDNELTCLQDVITMKDILVNRLEYLDQEKFKLQGAAKKYHTLFQAHKIYERYSPISYMLDDIQQEKFKKAEATISKKGYKNNVDALGQTRIAMMDAAAKNKEEILTLRQKVRMLNNIIEFQGLHDRCDREVTKEVKEPWKEKQHSSYYRERR